MIGLPSNCAIIAVSASATLDEHEVNNDVLLIRYRVKGEERCHAICIFEFKNKLRGYDLRGTTTLPNKISFDSSPTTIAKAWVDEYGLNWKVFKGEWYD